MRRRYPGGPNSEINGVQVAPPKGPPPEPIHTNSTNRDLRTAGRYAVFTWARDGRVRVVVRRY